MVFVDRYKEPFDRITSDKNLKQAKKYELDNEEWDIVSDLINVLGVSCCLFINSNVTNMLNVYGRLQYKKATVFFSQDLASITAVIPAMDKLDNKMNKQTKQPLHPTVIFAMKLAKNKMDRYWKITDLSDVYRIAMGTLSKF